MIVVVLIGMIVVVLIGMIVVVLIGMIVVVLIGMIIVRLIVDVPKAHALASAYHKLFRKHTHLE